MGPLVMVLVQFRGLPTDVAVASNLVFADSFSISVPCYYIVTSFNIGILASGVVLLLYIFYYPKLVIGMPLPLNIFSQVMSSQ
jgi:uncharacterized membrane protein YfcA